MNDEFKMYEDKLKITDTGGYTIKGLFHPRLV